MTNLGFQTARERELYWQLHEARQELYALRQAQPWSGRSTVRRQPRKSPLSAEDLALHRRRCAARARLFRRGLSITARARVAEQALELGAVPKGFDLAGFLAGDGPRDRAPEVVEADERYGWLVLRAEEELEDVQGVDWPAFAERELDRFFESCGLGPVDAGHPGRSAVQRCWHPSALVRLDWPNGHLASVEPGRWYYPHGRIAIEQFKLVYAPGVGPRSSEDTLILHIVDQIPGPLRAYVRHRLAALDEDVRCLALLELALRYG